MNPILIIIIGVILLLSLVLQERVLKSINTINPPTVVAPFVIGLIVVLGVLANSIFLAAEQPRLYDEIYVVVATASAIMFGLVLILKTIFAPLFNGWLLSYSIFMFAEDGELRIWPGMEIILGLVFTNTNATITFAYTIVFVVYALITNGLGITNQ